MLRKLVTAGSVAVMLGGSVGALALAPASPAQPTVQRSVDPDNLSRDRVPPKAAEMANPFAGQVNAVRAGGKLFSRHCAECHGADASGTERGPSLRVRVVNEAEAGVLFWFLSNGNLARGMPEWSRLSPQRRWQLVSYLTSLDEPEH